MRKVNGCLRSCFVGILCRLSLRSGLAPLAAPFIMQKPTPLQPAFELVSAPSLPRMIGVSRASGFGPGQIPETLRFLKALALQHSTAIGANLFRPANCTPQVGQLEYRRDSTFADVRHAFTMTSRAEVSNERGRFVVGPVSQYALGHSHTYTSSPRHRAVIPDSLDLQLEYTLPTPSGPPFRRSPPMRILTRLSYIAIIDVQAPVLHGRKRTIRFWLQMRLKERIKSGSIFATTSYFGTRYSRSWMVACSRRSWRERSSWLEVRWNQHHMRQREAQPSLIFPRTRRSCIPPSFAR